MNPMPDYRLLIFDWDGTLMDSEARIVACLQGAVGETAAAPRTPAELRNVIGLGLAEAVRHLYPQAAPDFIEAFIHAYRRRFLDEDGAPSRLFEGADMVLDELERAGFWLAVATGKSRRGLDRDLRETGLAGRFHATRCADESHSKPHPAMVEELLQELGMPASDALVIGDSEYDMLMAHNARTDRLAVSYGVHEAERLLQHAPIALIHDIRELPACLTPEPAANP
ncbi:MAG: HAD-IA family hydrolase [Chromatiales bacterium]|nr:HAD-IA family hydrolase [Chromatiales bacterium]